MELLIYKASAGSGKTFTLTVEYIKRLMLNPASYKHILAVTFTNKATAEMKQRILQQLWGMSRGDDASQGYLEAVCDGLAHMGRPLSEEELRGRAAQALNGILHHYNHFAVETIDSFFQKVVRHLARELGVGSDMNIDLDSQQALDEAVDNLIAGLDEHSPTLDWICQFVNARLDDGFRWQVDREMKSFANHLFNEHFIEHGARLRGQIESRPGLVNSYKRQLNDLMRDTDREGVWRRDRFMAALERLELETTDLKGGKTLDGYLEALAGGGYTDKTFPKKTITNLLEQADNWATKTSKRRDGIIAAARETLLPLLAETEQWRKEAVRTKLGCQLSVKYLYQLQLLNAIGLTLQRENHEKNRFLLADTNQLLAGLTTNNDAPFIFEKMGESIRHIMIDEFQDTSRMQWHNFEPLLRDGIAGGYDSLIVGDVKQSIYRWRSADWNILNNLRPQETPYRITVKPLQTNYRSAAAVVRFNNALFRTFVQHLNRSNQEELQQDCRQLMQAYADVEQQPAADGERGYVKVAFVGKDSDNDNDYEQSMLQALEREVRLLMEKGVRPDRIAILQRRRNDGLAEWLSREMQLDVVSAEAFRLDASTAVCMIINALRYLDNPENTLALAALKLDCQLPDDAQPDPGEVDGMLCADAREALPAAFMEQGGRLRQMPLYELLEELCDLFRLQDRKGQEAYLFKFFDQAGSFLKENPTDMAGFLRHWDDKMHRTTISSGGAGGVQLMTIHASKGLEFDTVIIPHCDWPMTVNLQHEHVVWCHPQEPPYNRLALVPVNYGSDMERSVYEPHFHNERLQLWVDNLNLLYVAATRASNNLVILGKKEAKADSVSGVLREIMPQVAQAVDARWDEEELTMEYGTVTHPPTTKHVAGSNPLSRKPEAVEVRMLRSKAPIEFRESNQSARFMAEAAGQETDAAGAAQLLNRGRVMHELFASIGTPGDIDAAIARLTGQGVTGGALPENEVRACLHRAFSLPLARQWYDGSWQLFNECNIIWRDSGGKVQKRRPDRVMLKDGEMVVVDFKFGKPHPQYREQVREYVRLLAQMGYAHVRGYLWYVDDDNIEAIQTD